MQANPKYVTGQPMLIVDHLCDVGLYCVELHNFLLGDDIFVVTFSNLYDLFTLDALDISHALLRIVNLQKLASSIYSIYILHVSNKFSILRVGTCNNNLFMKRERSL
jgi:hypothetical protein